MLRQSPQWSQTDKAIHNCQSNHSQSDNEHFSSATPTPVNLCHSLTDTLLWVPFLLLPHFPLVIHLIHCIMIPHWYQTTKATMTCGSFLGIIRLLFLKGIMGLEATSVPGEDEWVPNITGFLVFADDPFCNPCDETSCKQCLEWG